jgi:predicted DNA-binding transcriptional regulator AlpA
MDTRWTELEVQEMSVADEEVREMISMEQILQMIPLHRNTLHRMIKEGAFPKAQLVTPHKKLWFKDEIIRWQKGLGAK